MTVKSVSWSDVANTTIHVVMDDGNNFYCPWPTHNRWVSAINKWIDDGNTIGKASPAPPPVTDTREDAIAALYQVCSVFNSNLKNNISQEDQDIIVSNLNKVSSYLGG
jgi:hypothetical protein